MTGRRKWAATTEESTSRKNDHDFTPLNYFQRSKKRSGPVNIANRAGIKLSHDYQLRKFI